MIAFLFLMLWIFYLSTLLLGTWILFRQLNPPSKESGGNKVQSPLGISILKPLKGADPGLAENLESFFKLKVNRPYEILFSLESQNDEAYPIACSLQKKYPEMKCRIFILTPKELGGFKNPKIKNLSQSFNDAQFDLIWISDSNVWVRPEELEHLVSLLDEKTGMVTSIVAGVKFQGLGGYLESVFLGTFYARFMALSNQIAKPCVVGKSMLFRKSDTLRFGGLSLLADFLAEDFMAGEAMRRLGLKIRTSSLPVLQTLGSYSFQSFWKRHLRWGRIRKAHAPLAFIAEPFFGSLVMSVLGTFSIAHFHTLPFGAVLLSNLGILCFLDVLCYLRTSSPPLKFVLCFPALWLLRETLAPLLWIQIASSNKIDWRGNEFTLAPGGLLGEK